MAPDKPKAVADPGMDPGTDPGTDLGQLSLTDAIKAVATGHERKPGGPPPEEPSLTQALKDVASRRRTPPTTRAGRKGVVIYVDQDVAAAIRRLAGELNTTVQALGTTAFDLLLEKFGEPRTGQILGQTLGQAPGQPPG